jgi:hypothetical protein
MVDEQDTAVRLPVLGALTYREWHAAVNGLYAGARWGDRPHVYQQERHYWRVGYLLGTATRYLLVAVVARWLRRKT